MQGVKTKNEILSSYTVEEPLAYVIQCDAVGINKIGILYQTFESSYQKNCHVLS